MKYTVALVGSHPRGAETFDFSRGDCDIWVFNEALTVQPHIQRADAVFQMHLEAIWRNPNNRNDPKHAEWLKSGDTPTIYMQDVYADVPKSVRYPLERVCDTLIPHFTWQMQNKQGDKYFSSTFCYALALAIYQGYRSIEVHGVEMETDTEYRYQRDGLTFWLGVALGRGIEVKAFTRMFDFPLYGYEGEAALHLDEFHQRIAELAPLVEAAKVTYLDQARKADDALNQFMGKGKDSQAVIDMMKEQINRGFELNKLAGMLQENEKYVAKAQAMTEHAGDFAFSRQEFEGALQGLGQKHDELINLATAAAGACSVLFNKAIEARNYHKRKRAMLEFIPAVRTYFTRSCEVGLHQGAANENARYLSKLDTLIKAAGGSKSEAVLLNVQVPA